MKENIINAYKKVKAIGCADEEEEKPGKEKPGTDPNFWTGNSGDTILNGIRGTRYLINEQLRSDEN